jgi:hypothetical protein
MRFAFVLLLFVHAIALVGCHHPPLGVGRSAFHFVEPEAPKSAAGAVVYTLPDDAPHTFVEPAAPIEPLAKPTYPRQAADAKLGPVLVGLRLTIDQVGRVASIEQSWRAFSSPNRWEAEFRAAAEAAVTQWRFHPAQIQVIQRVSRPGSGYTNQVRRSDPTDWTEDVSFTFTMSGEVISKVTDGPRPRR